MSSRRARWRSVSALVSRGFVATLFAVALTTGLALAHANLVRSDPPAGASLPTAPARVQLWFSEELEPSFSEAVVYDVNQQRVDRGDSHLDPNDPRSLIVSLKPNLPSGTYAIAWKTQSRIDGHVVRGIVPFGVGVASAAVPSTSTVGAATEAASGTPTEMLLRWLILLSTSGLVGSLAFWILQGSAAVSAKDRAQGVGGSIAERDELAPSSGGATRTLTRRGPAAPTLEVTPGQRRLAWLAWGLSLASNLAFVVDQASVAEGVSLGAAIGGPSIRLATETQVGRFWIARLILVLALGALLALRGRGGRSFERRSLDLVALFIGAVVLLTISLTSHSAALGSLSALGVANDWLHLAAVAVWVSGLLQLLVLLPWIVRIESGAARTAVLGTLVPRFAVVAGVALAALGATGLVEAVFHVGTLDNLLNDGYGQALLAKIVLILPLVAIAAINHFVVRPVFLRGGANPSPAAIRQARETAGLFRWTVSLEALFAIAVVAAAGVMTSLSPAQQPAASEGGPLTLSATAGDLTLAFTLSPGRPGPNRYMVEVRDTHGVLVAGARASLRFTYLDSDLGVSEAELTQSGSGRFEGQSSDLAVAGRWQTEVIVRRPGHDDVSAVVGYLVTTDGARSLQSVPIELGWRFYVGLVIVVTGVAALARGAALRPRDLRRGLAVMLCGICLGGIGGALALQDVQQAEVQAAAATRALAHPATAESIASGATIFQQNCAVCHGADARGDGPLAPTLNPRPSNLIIHVPQHPDADLEGWIANGFPGSAMPAFKDKLTEQQRWDVLNYLKAQARGSDGPASGDSGSSVGSPGGSGAATPRSLDPKPSPSAPVPTVVASPALPPAQPTVQTTTADEELSRRVALGDVTADVQITPRIYEPAEVDVRLTNRDGSAVTDVRRVDVQVAMEGMDHGARGVEASQVGSGRYRARALLLAMEGKWLLALRVERANGQVASSVTSFQAPHQSPSGAVSALYERPTDPVQIEDVAVYPMEINPPSILVRNGHPARLEIIFVDHPSCGSTVTFEDANARSSTTSDGLAELSFVPDRDGTIQLACTSSGVAINWKQQ